MISNAPTNGAHVMSDSTGMPAVIGASSVTRVPVERGEDAVSSPELGPDEEEEHAEGDAIHVVLRLAALHPPEHVAPAERPRAQHVEHAVDEIAIDPSDEAREPQDERVDAPRGRSEEHTSELQSHSDLVCRLL